MIKTLKMLALIVSLVIITLVCGVHAEQINASVTTVNVIPSDLTELPDLDMTGLHSDIELIEVDSDILNATEDWIVLAHDDAGKEALIGDIDGSSLLAAEKTDLKSAVRNIWDTYPTKFVDAGEKSIEITVQSDGSKSTKAIPIGHVTRIEFNREKIRQAAQGKTMDEAKRLVALSSSSAAIVLTDAENQTVKNITGFRSKLIRKDQASQSQLAPSSGSSRTLSSGGSFSASNSVSPGSFSSSGFARSSGLSSSAGDNFGKSGMGLTAWSGGYTPPENSEDPPIVYGHNSFIYWACQKMNFKNANDAAAVAMEPDAWTSAQQPIILPFHLMFTLPVPDFVPFYNLVVHSYDHYWNPDRRDPDGNDQYAGNAPYIAADYSSISKQKYAANRNDPDAAKTLGWASHFFTDVSNPMHTGKEFEQIWDNQVTPYDTHAIYEDYMSYYSSHALPYGQDPSGDSYTYNTLIRNDEKIYYRVTSPETAAKNIAIFSHSYLNTLYYKVQNLPPRTNTDGSIIHGTGFEKDGVVQRITDNCVRVAARYSAGFVAYAMNANTVNEIPVADFTADPNPICSGDYDVRFIDLTHNTYRNAADPMHLTWYFGDGFTRTGDYNIVHQYSKAGTYKVRLETWNSIGKTEKTTDIIIGECAPAADFSVSSLLPYSISVTDHSLYSPTQWRWDFGDGTISTEQNPSHTYKQLHYYTVKLTASNEYGSGTRSVSLIPLPPSPVAVFWVSKTTGLAPLSVQFTDQSIGYVSSREWDFGDNSPVSTEQTITHEYNHSGTYTAKLTVNGNGISTNTTTIVVTAAPPVANFTATPTSGTAPLTVRFTDTSSGDPTGWNWYFGDDGSSNLQNPMHTFTGNRSYTVTLITLNNGGSSTKTWPGYITVTTEPPVASFTATPISGTDPLLVRFTDTSTNSPTSWLWDFGDGKTNTDQNPKHVYTSAGTYTVTLTAKNAGGSGTETRTGFITVEPTKPGTYEFTWDDNGKTVTVKQGSNLNVTLEENLATGYTWRFFNSHGLTGTGSVHIPSPSGLLGAPRTRVVSYSADTPGPAAISAWYIPPGTAGTIADPFAGPGPESDAATRYLLLLNIT